ncbi:hypothetical protein ACP275_11G119800 [Erythranthe tilingii]
MHLIIYALPFGLILGPDSPYVDEPCGGTLRFSGHWILTNVCVTQADIFASASSANDLITIFVAPECFSLCSYLLSGYTKKDVRSNEATMKYLLMGGASSSILVHGRGFRAHLA